MAPAFQEDYKMFERLIESEPEGADFKTRRTYFMVSSLVVGLLFATAVVISIFAADIGLGNSSFELVEMIAPPEMAVVDSETPQPRPPTASLQTENRLPTRQAVIARIDETPIAPNTTSVLPNTQLSRPRGDFIIDPRDSDPVGPGTSGRDHTDTSSPGNGLSTPPIAEVVKEPEPPPIPKPQPVKNPPTQSLGVINGRAASLPKPTYPAAAIAVHAQGKVDVQVFIDETGRVLSANAVSGHPLLRNAAEQAARNARFTPTYLSKVPVKVTGVIVYNFTR